MTSLETSLDDNVVSPGFEAGKLAPQPAPGEAGVGVLSRRLNEVGEGPLRDYCRGAAWSVFRVCW